MKEIEYKVLGVDDLELLVELRIKDLKIFSNQKTATIYYYDILPSNENPKGKVGQITNVWVDENYRHLGIGRYMVEYLIENYQKDVGMICLNSSKEGINMYLHL